MSHGPVQYFVFAFPGNQFKGEIVPALADVVSKGLIRIVDISFVLKDAEGNVATMEINELPAHVTSAYGEVVGANEGLLSLDDIERLSADIPPNNSAALLVFEHVWAAGLADSIRNANGQVVAQGFVPHDIVEEILAAGAYAA
jgi:hypothetical protein